MVLDYNHQEEWAVPGKDQSPVKLNSETAESVNQTDALVFDTEIIGESVSQSNNSFRITGHGSAVIDGDRYQFQEVHFHAPSEHVVDEHSFAMEWHFVFRNQQGATVVVARFVELGTHHDDVAKTATLFVAGQEVKLSEKIDLTPILREIKTGFHYQGSLTTPPLTEGVSWYVAINPYTISKQNFDTYRSVFSHDNHRDLQPLNGRKVTFGRI